MSKQNDIRVEIRPLTDAQPDPANANAHTQRGAALLENSMRKRGFFRPIAAAGKGTEAPVVLAGNLTQETAVNVGLGDEAVFIYTDGSRPVVHVRTDLDPDSPEAKLLALEDNRIAEVSLEWKPEEIQAAMAQGVEVGEIWKPEELEALTVNAGNEELPEFREYDESTADDVEYIECPECGHKFPK